jgi:predicted amidohydrolase YtcJ
MKMVRVRFRGLVLLFFVALAGCASPPGRGSDPGEPTRCTLSARDSLDQVLTKVRTCMATSRTGWLQGSGWVATLFESVPFIDNPLDYVETTGPIALRSADGRAYWVNHVALALAGITAATRDPAGGKIGRIRGTYRPNGLLFGNAMTLVDRLIPKPPRGMARLSP